MKVLMKVIAFGGLEDQGFAMEPADLLQESQAIHFLNSFPLA